VTCLALVPFCMVANNAKSWSIESRLDAVERLAPQDILTAVQQQNLIFLPDGKDGQFEYDRSPERSPEDRPRLTTSRVKVVGNSTIYLRDVANGATLLRRRPTSCARMVIAVL